MRPGHGSQRSAGVTAGMESLGGGRWRVTVPGGFKGIILNSATQGKENEKRNMVYYAYFDLQEAGRPLDMVSRSKAIV